MIRKNSKVNFKKKEHEDAKPQPLKKEKHLAMIQLPLDFEPKRFSDVTKDRDDSLKKQKKALQTNEFKKKTKISSELVAFQTKGRSSQKKSNHVIPTTLKNEIESSDVTVQKIARKKLSNAKSLKKNVTAENKILLRKKSTESFKNDYQRLEVMGQKRETNSTVKTNLFIPRQNLTENAKFQQRETSAPKNQELKKYWSKRDLLCQFEHKPSEREKEKYRERSLSKKNKNREEKSKSLKRNFENTKSEKSIDKIFTRKTSQKKDSKVKTKVPKNALTLQKSKSLKSIHELPTIKKDIHPNLKEKLLESLVLQFKSKITELDKKVSYLYHKNNEKDGLKKPKSSKRKDIKKIDFDEDFVDFQNLHCKNIAKKQKIGKKIKNEKIAEKKFEIDFPPLKKNFSKQKFREVPSEESFEKNFNNSENNSKNSFHISDKKDVFNENQQKNLKPNEMTEKDECFFESNQKFNLTNILKVEEISILNKKHAPKAQNTKNQIADIRTIINFSNNQGNVLKEVIFGVKGEKKTIINTFGNIKLKLQTESNEKRTQELDKRSNIYSTTKKHSEMENQSNFAVSKKTKFDQNACFREAASKFNEIPETSLVQSSTNLYLLEKEKWKIPSKNLIKRHSRELAISNFSNSKKSGDITPFPIDQRLLPLNSMLNLEQSLIDTKRTQDIFKNMNNLHESFQAPLTTRSILNNSRSIIIVKNDLQSPNKCKIVPLTLNSSENFDFTEKNKNQDLKKSEKNLFLEIIDKGEHQNASVILVGKQISSNCFDSREVYIDSEKKQLEIDVQEISDYKNSEPIFISHNQPSSPNFAIEFANHADELTNNLMSFLLDDMLMDPKFHVMIYPEKIKGIDSHLPYIKSYSEKLIEIVKVM